MARFLLAALVLILSASTCQAIYSYSIVPISDRAVAVYKDIRYGANKWLIDSQQIARIEDCIDRCWKLINCEGVNFAVDLKHCELVKEAIDDGLGEATAVEHMKGFNHYHIGRLQFNSMEVGGRRVQIYERMFFTTIPISLTTAATYIDCIKHCLYYRRSHCHEMDAKNCLAPRPDTCLGVNFSLSPPHLCSLLSMAVVNGKVDHDLWIRSSQHHNHYAVF